jgi:predicted amidophosphoribosyltransferase
MLDLIAPPACVCCGAAADGDLCASCAERIVVLDEPGAAGVRSLVVWSEPVRAITLHLKRRGSRATANAIGALLAGLVRRDGLGGDVVTYVPGTRARGFDHAELIARATASTLGRPLRRLLRRTRPGPRQADVDLAHRRSNVEGRFTAQPVSGSVLLVDDVFTTGATAEACVRALGSAGASRVDVVTWARTLRRRPILSR